MNFIRSVSRRKTHVGIRLNDACVEQINQAPQPLAQAIQLQIGDEVRTACLLFRANFVLILLLGAGCAALNSNSEADIASTWTQAHVYLPRVSSYVRPAEVSFAQKLPTVVYIHGCTGLTVPLWEG